MSKPADQELNVTIQNGILNISIGINTLVGSIKHSIYFSQFKAEDIIITNLEEFSKNIADALSQENVFGTTIIKKAFDLASKRAVENSL
jgi:hypothetical protein